MRAPPPVDVDVEVLDVPELVETRQRLREILRGCEKMEREERRMGEDLAVADEKLVTVGAVTKLHVPSRCSFLVRSVERTCS